MINLQGDVEYIGIAFENCESIVMPIEKLEQFFIKGLKENIYFHKRDTKNLSELTRISCEGITLLINYSDKSELEYDVYESPMEMLNDCWLDDESTDDKPNVLGRILAHNDITHIDLLNSNRKVIQSISVPYEEGSGHQNNLMKVSVDKFFSNTLWVEIGTDNYVSMEEEY